ncbi:MAG: hypothetical protein NTW69_02135 [Chloroflexi bacterium]|nr:hypothetical protein [Chloroflexota bacterium]
MTLRNTEALYLTTGQDSVEIQIPESADTEIDIQARTFNWKSKVDPDDFRLVEHLEWNRLYGNSGNDDSNNHSNIFDWIKHDPLFFTMGLCGEGLNYSPAEKAAGFTRLNSIALLTSPDAYGSADSTGKVALLIRFGDVVSFSINNKNYLTAEEIALPAEEIALRVIQKNHSTIGGLDFVATEINDSNIAICDGTTHLQPGFICYPNGHSISDSTLEFWDLNGSAQELTIRSPKGWSEQPLATTDLPENTKLTVSAQSGNVEISQKGPSGGLEIKGDRLSAKANGDEQFRSRWEALPIELQSAYIAGAFAFALAIIGNFVSNWLTFASFFAWLFSMPRYRQPVNLPAKAHIFKLINGKKISGIIKSFDGRSTYRVFVLTEVREWDKDNWGDVLATEVRVPQNQIEMYYKAHP